MTIDNILSLLSSVPELTHRAMFGGYGLYSEGRIFALADEGVVYLKGDQLNISSYESAGAEPFLFLGPNGPASMKYYKFPSNELLLEHLDSALACAHRAPMPKKRVTSRAK